MDWTRVESSNIEAVHYDEKTDELYVKFKSGSVYHYFNVPYVEYRHLLDADSKGKYLSEHIKGHKYNKVEPEHGDDE